MSKVNPWIIFFGALAAGGFIWALNERTKKNLVIKQANKLEKDYLQLLAVYLEKQPDIPDEIKQQLIRMRGKFIGINDDIAIELKTIIELIEDNKEEIAIEKLTKTIENILKEKLLDEGHIKEKVFTPVLYEMLKKARDLKWISNNEFHFSCFLKDERNIEAHKLATRFPDNWKYISFFAGIEIIYNLKGISRI